MLPSPFSWAKLYAWGDVVEIIWYIEKVLSASHKSQQKKLGKKKKTRSGQADQQTASFKIWAKKIFLTQLKNLLVKYRNEKLLKGCGMHAVCVPFKHY